METGHRNAAATGTGSALTRLHRGRHVLSDPTALPAALTLLNDPATPLRDARHLADAVTQHTGASPAAHQHYWALSVAGLRAVVRREAATVANPATPAAAAAALAVYWTRVAATTVARDHPYRVTLAALNDAAALALPAATARLTDPEYRALLAPRWVGWLVTPSTRVTKPVPTAAVLDVLTDYPDARVRRAVTRRLLAAAG